MSFNGEEDYIPPEEEVFPEETIPEEVYPDEDVLIEEPIVEPEIETDIGMDVYEQVKKCNREDPLVKVSAASGLVENEAGLLDPNQLNQLKSDRFKIIRTRPVGNGTSYWISPLGRMAAREQRFYETYFLRLLGRQQYGRTSLAYDEENNIIELFLRA
jgi:hypothetical protein